MPQADERDAIGQRLPLQAEDAPSLSADWAPDDRAKLAAIIDEVRARFT